MDPTDLSDAQLDQLADQLAGRLPSGTHGDRVVLSRRAFAAAVGGTLGASGLVALGVDEASAQAAGQVGTSSSPVDAFTYDLVVQNALQSDLDAGGNKLTNVGSLSTEGFDNTVSTTIKREPTDGNRLDLYDYDINDTTFGDGYQQTSGVGTSSTQIFSLTGGTNASLLMVVGFDGSDNRFSDIIHVPRSTDVINVISSLSVRGSPAGRSYTKAEFDIAVNLSMDTDTYEVAVRSIEVRLSL